LLAPKHVDEVVASARAALQRVVMNEIKAERVSASGSSAQLPANVPQLQSPLTGAASLIALTGALQRAMLEGNVDAIQADAALWGALSDSQRNELTTLQSTYDAAADALQDANAAEQAAQMSADAAKAALVEAQQDEQSAQSNLDQAKRDYADAVAAGAPPDELDSLQANATAAQQVSTDASKTVANARVAVGQANDVLRRAHSVSVSAAKDATSAGDKLDSGIQRALNTTPPNQAASGAGGDTLTGAAALTLLMGKLNSVCAKAAEDQLESQRELYEQQEKSNQNEAMKEAQDYQDQQRKSEQMQTAMGCLGKILGAIVTVFSVVAAAFTGGASLAIAGVGLALFAADQIDQAVTGTSFISEALQPLMDHVLKPLMNFLADTVTKALEAFGVAADKARLIGSIIGGVLAGVTLIAAAVVGGSIISSVASKLASAISAQIAKLAESAIAKALTEAVEGALEKSGIKQLASKLATGMDRVKVAVGADTPEGAQLIHTRIKYAAQGVQATDVAVRSGLNIAVGFSEKDADDAIAKMKTAIAENKFFQELMDTALDTYTETIKALGQMVKAASESIEQDSSTVNFELANLRSA
jgi:invasin B